MKRCIAILTVATLAWGGLGQARAGDEEWATAGKILTGLVAAHVLTHVIVSPPVYYHAPPVVYAPAPICVTPAPVVYAPPPVHVYRPPLVSLHVGLGYGHAHRGPAHPPHYRSFKHHPRH